MKAYDVILLDIDGTLLDFNMAERQGISAVLEANGVEPTEELMQRYHHINQELWKSFERGDIAKEEIMQLRFPRLFETLGKTVDVSATERLYRSCLNHSAVLLDGAWECCQYLKGKYRLYVVTNGVSETQYQRLKDSGLEQFFQDVFVSEDAGSQKPQKEFFDYCFRKIPKADPGKMLIIGDSLTSDIKGGNAAGIHTCWYNPEGQPKDQQVQVTYEIRHLRELQTFL